MTAEFGATRHHCHHVILRLFCPTEQQLFCFFRIQKETSMISAGCLLCMGLFSRFLLEALQPAATLALPAVHRGDPMPIQHFAPPPHVKAPPLSFATRAGDLLFVSGIPGFDALGSGASGELRRGLSTRSVLLVLPTRFTVDALADVPAGFLDGLISHRRWVRCQSPAQPEEGSDPG
jgi:hypothetical protein